MLLQLTVKVLERAIQRAKTIHVQGRPDAEVLALLTQDLRDFGPHTIRRIFDMSLERVIPDDIPSEQVQKELQIKEGTVDVTVKHKGDFGVGDLIKYRDVNWVVVGIRGNGYRLKLVQ